jgi:hypothetical protein
MIRVRRGSDGPTVQTTEAVAFTFPAQVAGQYNFDIAVESELRGDPMCVVTFDNFTFEILVLGQGMVAPHTVRLNVFYLVDLLVPRDVDMHIQLSAHDLSQVAP